jgi:lactoylglutathione lyase
MITGIGHVAFRVTDLERALHFYCDMLGFREAFRLDREGEPSPWIVYLQIAPGCFIELFPGVVATGARLGPRRSRPSPAPVSSICGGRTTNPCRRPAARSGRRPRTTGALFSVKRPLVRSQYNVSGSH